MSEFDFVANVWRHTVFALFRDKLRIADVNKVRPVQFTASLQILFGDSHTCAGDNQRYVHAYNRCVRSAREVLKPVDAEDRTGEYGARDAPVPRGQWVSLQVQAGRLHRVRRVLVERARTRPPPHRLRVRCRPVSFYHPAIH